MTTNLACLLAAMSIAVATLAAMSNQPGTFRAPERG
jgi:hypothetical protein